MVRGNVSRGGGGSLNRYLLDERKREKGKELENPIFHSNMVGETTAELSAEFQLAADLRPGVRRNIAHFSISFPSGENPSIETKRAIVDDLLHQMEHDNCQFFAVQHFDQQHKRGVNHLHVAVSTIRLDGSWVDNSHDRYRLKDAERAIELKHNLQYCPPRAKGERRNLTTGESRQEERTGEPCAKRKLWETIDRATADKPNLSTALLRVRAAGADVRFSEFEDGGKGLSFGLDGKHFPGKRLGSRYSFYGLQQYAGLNYQPDRDDPVLREIEKLSPQQCQERLQTRSTPPNWEAELRSKSLELREWLRDSLQQSPQASQIKQPETQAEPVHPVEPVEQKSDLRSRLDSEIARSLERLRYPVRDEQPQSQVENTANLTEELQQFSQTDLEPQAEPQRNFAEDLQQFALQPEPEPEPDPEIERRADAIFLTAIGAMQQLWHKRDRTAPLEDGTLQIQGRYYWGRWDRNEKTLDYYDPSDERLLFSARQVDERENHWEITDLGDIRQQDVTQHEQIQKTLDAIERKKAIERSRSQSRGFGLGD